MKICEIFKTYFCGSRVLDERLPKIERSKFVVDDEQKQVASDFNKMFEDCMVATEEDQKDFDAGFENAMKKRGDPEKMKAKSKRNYLFKINTLIGFN